jgi:hypothetical protein
MVMRTLSRTTHFTNISYRNSIKNKEFWEHPAAAGREAEERARREAAVKREVSAEAAKKKAEEVASALEANREAARVASLPAPETPLAEQQSYTSDRTALVRAIQTELKRVGCDPGAVDGN